VVIATGGIAEEEWNELVRKSLPGVVVEFFYEPTFRYFSESRSRPDSLRRRIRAALDRLLPAEVSEESLVWAHNLGLARNLILADELSRLATKRKIPLLSHHHDFWFENRWMRWREMRECGFRTLSAVAGAIFGNPGALATINCFDKAVLDRRLPGRASWLPNLASRARPPSASRIHIVRNSLAKALGDDGPIWIVPTRFLRRKNLGEAVLLARWLRPEGWLVTTAGVSSRDEHEYARRLDTAARRGKWRARFCILSGEGRRLASIEETIAASEALLLTSVQEGFGLPYLEAAATGKPLLARALPNVSPDLKALGFQFPHLYQDVFVHPKLINWRAEQKRQRILWRAWKTTVPTACRHFVAPLPLFALAKDTPIPFSRLTLSAQLEVLAIPPEESWAASESFNSLLRKWRPLAASGSLIKTSWPAKADSRIGGSTYAERFFQATDLISLRPATAKAADRVQRDFIAQRLASDFLYPVLLEGI
jgi:glycosyltransferase involved in cell wall biosynthesis